MEEKEVGIFDEKSQKTERRVVNLLWKKIQLKEEKENPFLMDSAYDIIFVKRHLFAEESVWPPFEAGTKPGGPGIFIKSIFPQFAKSVWPRNL